MSKVIIDDVAARAGVSIKTVSRVMNNEPNVSERTRDRVLAAARELNYRPSLSARGLAGSRSYLIGLLYDNPSPAYLAEIQAGLLEACEASHYSLALHPCRHEDPGMPAAVSAALAQARLDGLIITPPVCNVPALMAAVEERGVPYAVISDEAGPSGFAVTIDESAAMRDLTEHVIGLGHTRIGFIAGHPDHKGAARRRDGFETAMRTHGLGIDPAMVVQGYFDFESGRHGARELLSRSNPPTSIIAANDDMAAGALQVAHDKGLHIPTDLVIVGFDDSPLSRQVWPPLTTVRQPVADMAREAAARVIARLTGAAEPDNPADLAFPHELRLRQSSLGDT
ncbi:LacI family DNA-binding transcriptional regulator [Gimibacter soli]|uniref:LacI family DNA-binding transcriptional regulator n=1 Tax=Gimibacter soli TaxID=3024400 RepID=A0AAF0BM57_9PROT|nr:LacI family DNA-binding transcriptional regulator [Gimibacter soli]WCL54105.1 LacI family DNA-binding transcriptional regulator [Gimibacter soli]